MLNLVHLGDRAWLARFPNEAEARKWASAATRQELPGITDIVLAYHSVSIHVDPHRVTWERLEDQLRRLSPDETKDLDGRTLTIPVLYQGDDLSEVARLSGLSVDRVIQHHTDSIYDVFAVGFQPGFPYAGDLPPPLDRIPRRKIPRVRVPAGSVAIAAGQTGIYPGEYPGGWQLIGRTPLTIVDLTKGHFPIRAGDRLRFVAIEAEEFAVRKGEWLE